ncbi:MAG TPA: hypothetical protein VIV66_19775 [Pyrinomonadaceae bacterium]
MKSFLLMLVFLLTLCVCGCSRTPTIALSGVGVKTESSERTKVDFDSQVKPILQQRCQPCHFNGGVMYARLPFDRPATIRTLGTKMFTRIKDEREQRVIREFLEQKE